MSIHKSNIVTPVSAKLRSEPEFGHLTVAAVIEPDQVGEALIREMRRTRAQVVHIWPVPSIYPVEFDMLFSELFDDLPAKLPWSPGEPPLALSVVLRNQRQTNYTALRNSAPHCTISLPAGRDAVMVALATGLAQFQYEKRLRTRIDKLDDYIRAIRSVERAKTVIMSRRQLNEDEAYHYLRRQAMSRRVSIGELALAIIDTDELLG